MYEVSTNVRKKCADQDINVFITYYILQIILQIKTMCVFQPPLKK